MDGIELLRRVSASSVHAIISDPPYGMLNLDWDRIPCLDDMWCAIKRAMRPTGVAVFTAAQPFTTDLIQSNRAWFRYDMVWCKTRSSGWLNANRMPLRQHETIVVFGMKAGTYNPMMKPGSPYRAIPSGDYSGYNATRTDTINNGARYPTSVINIANESNTVHPTQKPLELMMYLVQTYTNPGDLIVDPFCGSGTTLVAARALGRHYLGADLNEEYVEIARQRIAGQEEVNGSQKPQQNLLF